jgi:hydrogenase maturation protease
VTTHVVCFGNAWHGDDGFGLHVLRRLPERDLVARGAVAFDAGTAGLNALGYFEGCAKAVIVDAVRTGGRVGSVHRLEPADLEPPGGEHSLHDLGVAGVLAALAAVADDPPEVVVVGAEVGEVRAFTDRLSPPLQAALPAAVGLVLRECSRAVQRVDHPEQVAALVEVDREQSDPAAAKPFTGPGASQQRLVGVDDRGVGGTRHGVAVDPVVEQEQRCG